LKKLEYKSDSDTMSDDKNLEKTSEEVVEKVVTTTEETKAPAATAADDESAESVALEEIKTINLKDDSPHDDFDWSISNRHTHTYDEKEVENYLKDYEQSLGAVDEFEIIKGKVSAINQGDVILDINYKSDGLIPLSEFRGSDLTIGDEVEVYVEAKEDDRGQLVLSRRKAKLLRAWEMLLDSYENGTIIKGTIVSKTKGGLIADCSGLETFLPGSQIDIKPIIDYDIYVGKTMEFKVVKINEAIKNAVVSHKALIESDIAEQRDTIIAGLEKGQVLEGIVKNITDFGAFMDLGGVDGLLYITDISWGRINHPNEVLELNQKVNVAVLDFDENKNRISLGLKQLQPHPWEVLDKDYVEGSLIKGKIVNIEDYGAFLEIIPGVEGLIHVSEVSWSNQPVNARQHFTLGQEFEAKVVTIDREDRKMSLSVKQLTEDPWSQVITKYPIGSKQKGIVKNLTPYGVFVEMEAGIGGMVHISDLSWTKRYSHPSEFTKIGEEIDITILEVDQDSRKLSLGHKQLEENPWDTFENIFPVGSYHEATIIRKDDRGAIVQLPYGLESFAPAKHLKKEDGSYAQMDEKLTFKVIEFSRDDKRIIVSHLRYLDDIKREATDEVRSEQREQKQQTRKAVTNRRANLEKTTLGELDVFSQMKSQLAESDAKAAAAASTAATPKEAVAAEAKAKEEAPVAEVKEEVAEVKEEVVEAKAEVKEEAPATEAKADTGKPDDLKKIEGVGPKISELLAAGGFDTFAKLAAAEVDAVKAILTEAGSRYQMHDPTSWPIQAKMAADGEWEKLEKWQDEHKGGKMS